MPPASTSSHVRGTATNACSRPRSDQGAMVVLRPLFWLQSTKTLPGRRSFVMRHTTRSGRSRVSAWASCLTYSEVISVEAPSMRLPRSAA